MQTFIKLLFSFILSVLFTYTATAQTTYTWNGGSGDWNVATNWTPVGVPGAPDNAIINSGTVTLTTNVTVTGVELSSTLSGGFDLEITNLMIWSAGVMQGAGVTTIAVGATLRLSGTNQQTLRRQIDNNGTIIWEAGQFYLADAVAINNNGTFLDQHSGTKTLSGGFFGCVFNNNGTYTKSGVGESKLDIPFYNIGSLDLQVGILLFQRLCTSSGTINVGNGSVLKLQGPQLDIISGPLSGAGTVDFGATTSIRGIYDITGSTIFTNRTTVFDTSATIVSLNNGQELLILGTAEFNTGNEIVIDSLYLSGTLQGSDPVTIMKSMNWNSQVMKGTGVTTIASGAILRLTGTNQQTLRRQIDNNGTIIWEAGHFYLADAVAINNNGTFLDQHPSPQQLSGGANGCVFNNNGTYTKSNTGQSDIRLPFYNISSCEIRGTGTMRILWYDFTNEGTVSPGDSLGTLTLETDYPTTTTSSLNIEIGGSPTSGPYDRLQTTGAATLDGTLNISLVNSFVPALGDTFEVLTYLSYTGNFSTINGLNTGTGISFDTVFTSTALVLITIATPVYIEDNFGEIPQEYTLAQNYPNPFNPTTKIKYQIPEISFVNVKVYDVLGNEITTLVNQEKPAGYYEIEFIASYLASGIYFYRIQAGSFVEIKKMVLLR